MKRELRMTAQQDQQLNLYEKLVEVRKAALYATKSGKGYNFSYVTGSDILAMIRPRMDDLGLVLIPNMESVEIITLKRPKGDVDAIKITMSFTWVNSESPTEQITTHATYIEDKMTGCQGVGSVQTYAERYFLTKFFQIATDSDSPEKYYEKHGLSPFVEGMQKEDDKQPKLADFSQRTDAEYEKVASMLWASMQRQNPEYEGSMPDDFSAYARYCQTRRKNVRIEDAIDFMAKNPEKLLAGYRSWLDRDNRQAAEKPESQKVG